MNDTLMTGNDTILITGGSSGIGLELARALLELGNTVIVCSRTEEKLERTRALLPQVDAVRCDISDVEQRAALVDHVLGHHPGLNMLVNNAATVSYLKLRDPAYTEAVAARELATNFLAPVALTRLLLRHLERQRHSAIVNVTTGLVYAPHAGMPGYCASKAALHSFTQCLRLQLTDVPIRIVEVLMAAVDTPFHDGGHVPKMSITAEEAVRQMIRGLRRRKEEIRIGRVRQLSLVARVAPRAAIGIVNKL